MNISKPIIILFFISNSFIVCGCKNTAECNIPKNRYFSATDSIPQIGPVRLYTSTTTEKYPSLKVVNYFDSIWISMKLTRYTPRESEVNDSWAKYPSSFGRDSGKTIVQYSTDWKSNDSTCLISMFVSNASERNYPDTSFQSLQTITVVRTNATTKQFTE
jgi:hypothetical protein